MTQKLNLAFLQNDIKTIILTKFQHAKDKYAASSVNKIFLQFELMTQFLTSYDQVK